MLKFVLRDFQTFWRQTTGSGVDRLSRGLNSVDDRVKNRPVIIWRLGKSRKLRQQVKGIRKCGNRNRNVLSRSREESVNAQTCDVSTRRRCLRSTCKEKFVRKSAAKIA